MTLDQVLVFLLLKHRPLVKHTVDLPFKLAFHITVLNTKAITVEIAAIKADSAEIKTAILFVEPKIVLKKSIIAYPP